MDFKDLPAHASRLTAGGFVLCTMPLKSKGPQKAGWQLKENCLTSPESCKNLHNKNIGLVHEHSGTCCLDIDQYDETAEYLLAQGIDLEELLRAAPFVIVGKRGVKPLYRVPKGIKLKTQKVLNDEGAVIFELRAAGGQDVLPPSVHPEGITYTWGGDMPTSVADLPILPSELLALWLSLEPHKGGKNDYRPLPIDSSDRAFKYCLKALQSEATRVATTGKGGRNEALYNATHAVAGFVPALGGRGAEFVELIRDEMTKAGEACGLEPKEIAGAIRNGIKDGSARPREIPESQLESQAPKWEVKEQLGKGNRVEEVKNREIVNGREIQHEGCTELANAVRAAKALGGKLCYSDDAGMMIYNPDYGIWEPDALGVRSKEMIRDAAATAIRSELADLAIELANSTGEAEIKALRAEINQLTKWLARSESNGVIKGSFEIIKGLLLMRQRWDDDKLILNLPNGVLDLVTGELYEHDPEQYLTKRANVEWQGADATHPGVDAMLELLKRDDRLVHMQRVLGSCLCGLTPNEKIFYLLGEGGTGKGTLLETFCNLLGDYAVKIDANMLIESKKQGDDKPRADLLALRGARLALAGELPKGVKMNASEVKALTGRDAITGRALYSSAYITFYPEFKLLISSNYALRADWDDSGVVRRLDLIPFNAKPETPDPHLKEVLMYDEAAKSAMLAFAYKGFKAWYSSGFNLAISQTIEQYTAAFWDDSDPFRAFGEDCLSFEHEKDVCPASDLWKCYQAWCEENGQRPLPQKELGLWLAKKGATPTQRRCVGKMTRLWESVTIRT